MHDLDSTEEIAPRSIINCALNSKVIWLSSSFVLIALLLYGNTELLASDSLSLHSIFETLSEKAATSQSFGIALMYFAILFTLFTIRNKVELSRLSGILGFVAGILLVVGRNYLVNDDLSFVVSGALQLCYSIIALCGYTIACTCLFELVWRFLSEHSIAYDLNADNYAAQAMNTVFNRRPFLYPTCIIAILWLPYLIAFFPGILHFDSLFALDQYYGDITWSTHFSPLSVVLMGYAMDIGKAFGSDNIGCAVYVLPQYAAFLLTLSYTFVFFKEWSTPYWLRLTCMGIYALFPVFPMYAMSEVKDTLYYIAFVWVLFAIFRYQRKNSAQLFLFTAISVMLMCSIRNDGKYVCTVVIVFALLFGKNVLWSRAHFAYAIASGIVLSITLSSLLCTAYSIEPGHVREALSIPIQQTARYVRDNSDDITDAEWTTLDQVFSNQAHQLGEKYTPNRSDDVKWLVTNDFTSELEIEYAKTWFSQFLRHPETYVSAAFNQAYGYFYVDKPEFYTLGFSTGNPKTDQDYYFGDIEVKDNPRTEKMRRALTTYFYSWKTLPVINLLYRPAFYTWLSIISAFYLIRSRRKEPCLITFSLSLGVLIICSLSPLNGALRYCLPIALSCFALMAYSIRTAYFDDESTVRYR